MRFYVILERPRKAALAAILAAVTLLGCRAAEAPDPDTGAAAGAVERAFAARASDVAVEVTGEVRAVLKDDREGSRHQRFVVALPSGHTVLVAHNIDLAPRVPVVLGSRVTVRGQFEWNPKGGVIHWTHLDPRGEHPPGFVALGERRYQ